MGLKIAFDIDGCLSNFQPAYIDTTIRITGKDLFPKKEESNPHYFDIPCWNYPEHYGYTPEEMKAVWGEIKSDDMFWFSLKPYEDAFYAMEEIAKLWKDKNDIYFITDRPGANAKLQTEAWLLNFRTLPCPTVLVTGNKGPICEALKIDILIDDKDENCEAARRVGTDVVMIERTWNHPIAGVPRIPDWKAFFTSIEAVGESIQ